MSKRREKKLYDVVLPEGTPPDLRRVIEYVNAVERRMDGIPGPLPPPIIPPGVAGSRERAMYAALLSGYRSARYLEQAEADERNGAPEDEDDLAA